MKLISFIFFKQCKFVQHKKCCVCLWLKVDYFKRVVIWKTTDVAKHKDLRLHLEHSVNHLHIYKMFTLSRLPEVVYFSYQVCVCVSSLKIKSTILSALVAFLVCTEFGIFRSSNLSDDHNQDFFLLFISMIRNLLISFEFDLGNVCNLGHLSIVITLSSWRSRGKELGCPWDKTPNNDDNSKLLPTLSAGDLCFHYRCKGRLNVEVKFTNWFVF